MNSVVTEAIDDPGCGNFDRCLIAIAKSKGIDKAELVNTSKCQSLLDTLKILAVLLYLVIYDSFFTEF
ncbi:hypothetical protein DICVIV_09618 [Dictyocaulus viviparus]|uniref:Uncharacterized protein n=1 Tax=Dictyocaulus viviparus TaxID=29172 RepID=A0A0D8XKK8_DICVI|nr:hypothetical protein DICVIV_09618 [Dictyocaulus viviparus]